MVVLPETARPSILHNLMDGIVAHPYITIFILSSIAIGIYIFKDELKASVTKLAENVLTLIDIQKQIMKNEMALEASSQALVRVMEYSRAQDGISEKAFHELKNTVIYLSNMLIQVKEDHIAVREKLAETIVVIAKVIRANPGLDKDRLVTAVLNNPHIHPVDVIENFQ